MPKILAIEEINDNLIRLKAIINDAFPGFIVYTALNGPKGIELAIANNPDVILVDMIMPGMNGFEVCLLLKLDERVSDIPVVFLTDLNTDKGNWIKALEAGAEGFLSKPIDQTELTAQIRAMVKIKAANEQKRDEKERLEKMVEERTISLQKEVNERKKSEETLIGSEFQFREFFEKAADAIFIAEMESGILVDANEAASKLLLLPHNQIIGIHQSELHPPVKDDYSKETFNKHKELVKQNVLSYALENTVVRADGVEVPVEILASEVTYHGKRCMMGTFRDITERKKTEEALRLSEENLKILCDSSTDIICSYDLEGRFTSANKAFYASSGFPVNSIHGKTHQELGYPEDNCREWAGYHRQIIETKSSVSAQSATYMGDGLLHWFDIELYPLKDLNESLTGIGVTIRDITERKRVEELLSETNEFSNSLLNSIPFGMDIVDECGNVMFQNDNLKKLFGKEAVGRKCWDLYRDDKMQCSDCPLRKGIQVGVTELYETDQVLGGRSFQISHTGMMFQGKKAMLEIFQDITEKKKNEQVQQVLYKISNAALSAANLPELVEFISREIEKLLDSTNFFIAFYDEETNMLSTVYERDEKDILQSWSAERSITGYVIKHNKSLMINEEEMKRLNEAGEFEIYGTLSKIWLGVPLIVNKKAIGAIVVQSYDNPEAYTEKDRQVLEFISTQISIAVERKKAEQELKLMGKAFDQSPVSIAITDVNGNIAYINPKFTTTTGYTPEEVKGKNPRVLKSGNHSMEYYENLWKTITSGNDWVGEFQNRRKNGETYWESAVISPITNENGKIDFFLAIKEDITEKKKMIDDLILARNKAEEGDRLKSAFLANMSHEIRTPLNSIIGFSELMADPDFDAGQQTEFAKIIINSGNSLLSIISDIMDFSKIEAGQVVVKKTPFVLQNLIFSLQNEYSFAARGKGIELRIDPMNPKDDIWIRSDENRLKQVLVNLVGNAIKFTKDGYVEIGIKATGDCIQFQVSDTGIGILKEYHDEIFERFRQVESSNSRKYGGNGLGLAISKSLVEMMGGEIWVESEQEKGSSFYFTIPK